MKFQVRIRRELCLYKALDIEAASSEDAENQVQKLLNDGIPDSEFTGDGFEDEILDVTTLAASSPARDKNVGVPRLR